MKYKKYSILLITILLFVVSFLLFNKLYGKNNKPSEISLTTKELYEKEDIFTQIPFKTRLMSVDEKIGHLQFLVSEDGDYYFPEKSRKELSASNDSDLVAIKCMPEQIYLQRYYKQYSFLSVDGSYQEVNLIDSRILKIVDQLQNALSAEYTLSQFLICQTSDNRYIIKYNAIEKTDIQDGYNRDTNPVAFFTQIFPDGTIQDIAYIPVGQGSYCRYPIQLTKKNIFYFACSRYTSDGRKETPKGNSLYRLDLNKLNYSLISSCSFNGVLATCWY